MAADNSPIFRILVKSLGVCCPAEYIRLTRLETTQNLADYLGMTPRAIRYWRRWVAKGKVKCEHCSNCPRRPDALPIVLPRQRRRVHPPKDS